MADSRPARRPGPSQPRTPRSLVSGAVLSLLLSACADLTSPSTGDAPEPRSAAAGAQAVGHATYKCFLSLRQSTDPLWYRYARGATRFPRSAEAPDGATATYRFRSHDGAGQVVRLVRCEIPATRRAVEIMDRRLGVERSHAGRTDSSLLLGDVMLPGLEVNVCQYGGTYPYCDPEPLNLDDGAGPPPEEQICYDWSGCGDGGGTGGTSPDVEPECDPSLDPTCEQPLTEADLQTIAAAIQKHVRDPSILSDPSASAQCAAMGQKFQSLSNEGMVFRGVRDTQQGDPGAEPHFGAYDPNTGKLHFDPSHLDLANAGDPDAIREIANTALHESAHALGFDHDAGLKNPVGPGMLYSEDYFKWLSPGTNSCINW